MTTHEIAALEAQVNALDRETAERVTRLVFECSASLNLALQAVQEANKAIGGRRGTRGQDDNMTG
jgi:hypothetical protein